MGYPHSTHTQTHKRRNAQPRRHIHRGRDKHTHTPTQRNPYHLFCKEPRRPSQMHGLQLKVYFGLMMSCFLFLLPFLVFFFFIICFLPLAFPSHCLLFSLFSFLLPLALPLRALSYFEKMQTQGTSKGSVEHGSLGST